MRQESTEDLTTSIISSSKKIMKLLERDNIKLSEVDNYHLYPIADNDTPMLSSDRLEYSLSNSFLIHGLIDINKVFEIYDDIEILVNENNEMELGFKTIKICEEFVSITSKLSILYRDDKTRYSMQFLADIIKLLNNDGLIKKDDLYNLKESEIINLISNSKYKDVFKFWKNSKHVNVSSKKPQKVYFVHHGAKIRYIDPLCSGDRISKISINAKDDISNNLSYDMNNYVYLDFHLDM